MSAKGPPSFFCNKVDFQKAQSVPFLEFYKLRDFWALHKAWTLDVLVFVKRLFPQTVEGPVMPSGEGPVQHPLHLTSYSTGDSPVPEGQGRGVSWDHPERDRETLAGEMITQTAPSTLMTSASSPSRLVVREN